MMQEEKAQESVFTLSVVLDILCSKRKSDVKGNPVFVNCSHFVIASYLI